mgnify:CR=1 FL=1
MRAYVVNSADARVLAATIVVGPINEYVVRTSVPEQVDAASIYFTGLDSGEGHRKVTINWLEPGRGDWQWPILGYELQVTTDATFTSSVTAALDTDNDGYFSKQDIERVITEHMAEQAKIEAKKVRQAGR